MQEEQMKTALAHDAARKEAEGSHHLRREPPSTTGTYAPTESEYPPFIKPVQIKKGQVAAIILEDPPGHCSEYRFSFDDVRRAAKPHRIEIASQLLASWTRNTVPVEDADQRKQARYALELADVLIDEAAR